MEYCWSTGRNDGFLLGANWAISNLKTK